ncbi:MAG: radical SAM protein, partial [Candidatus Woesearchaeota archaeon]
PPFYRIIGFYNRYFPYGLTILATVLKNAGYDAVVYDADFITQEAEDVDISDLEPSYNKYIEVVNKKDAQIWKEMKEFIKRYSPDIVCISCWTTFIASTFRVAELVKELDKNTPVIVGGPHATLKPKEILESNCVDYIVFGEGEDTMYELVESLTKNPNKKPSGVKGIYYKTKGRMHNGGKRDFKKNMDEIPIADRSLLLNEKKYSLEDMGLLMTSRGCPFNCSYCATSIWERKVRYHSINRVIKEIETVKKLYKTTHFSIKDDTFTLNKERVKAFCKELKKRKLKITWDCNARVNLIDLNMLKIMKKAGCTGIKVGIESGSEKILKLMNKGITKKQIIQSARILRESGIHWTAYFMMGLPDETKEDMLKTLNLMRKIKPDYASLSVYEVFPGTALFDYGVRLGLVKEHMNIKDYFQTLPHNYYYKGGIRQTNTMSIKEFEKMEIFMKKEFERYNRGIRNILKRIKSRRKMYTRNPLNILDDFKKFIKWY